ncbi:MAG: hypothetical protein ACOVLC_00490 [Flavobacterium sp.]
MKKTILTLGLCLAFFATNAQEISKNALGIRLGDNKGFGSEINYQRGLGNNNRLEFGLGWRSGNRSDTFKIVGLYEWVWNIDGGFNWYAGVGGGFGSWSREKYNDYNGDSGTFIIAAGNIGIEYNFPGAPILLSLDFRPEFYVGGDDYRNDNLNSDIGLGIRYQF